MDDRETICNEATETESDVAEQPAPKKKRKLKRSDKIFIAIFNPLIALIIAAAILLPSFLKYKTVFIDDAVYENVFVAALGDKYEKLLSTDTKKIAVVGGSSVAFGLDSAALSAATGYEVVNFGLYATLGSKIMLDLSEDGLNAGDIVVFAPELDAQTMSLYFGARSAWQAIDANNTLYDAIKEHNGKDLEEAKEDFITDKKEYLEIGAPDPSGVYNRRNFNEYGDVNYPRPYNTMTLGYDPNTLFTLTPDIVSDDFIGYFNAYCERMKERGVTVYFSFCPINSLSVAEGVTDETIAEMELFFHNSVNCPVISSLDDYIMDWGYFYDTNLHLNDAGVTARTVQLAEDILVRLGKSSDVAMTVPVPPGIDPSISGGNAEGDNTFASLFVYDYETMPDGTVVGACIKGLSEEGEAFTGKEITVPASIDGCPVIRIMSEALSKMKSLEIIRIGTNISYIDDAAFKGCDSLKEIHIDFACADCTVSTPEPSNPNGFMEGAPDGCKIYCKEEYRNDFRNDYTWQHYYKYFA